MFGLYDKKIILISMIKNEEKIIRRCIDSVRCICDAFCVSDTMSTDNTVKIVSEYINELNKNNVPGKLYQNPWSDFGSNRTISYNNTVEFCKELGWDQDNTYGLLLDADMKLMVQSKFNKNNMTHNGYKIVQDNGHIEYDNTRFIKLNGSWKSVGVTHEYWDGPDLGAMRKDEIYISDIGDGGCKDNKFQRDLQLLTKGIEDEPNNGRYHFYLAQTHKDTGNHKEAIRLYKRRIEIGNVLTVSQTEGITVSDNGTGYVSAEKVVNIITIPAKLFTFNFTTYFEETNGLEPLSNDFPYHLSNLLINEGIIELGINVPFRKVFIEDLQGKRIMEIENNVSRLPINDFHGLYFLRIDNNTYPILFSY
jgi:glycosyltransferase involved in cell wall biosynthesis